MSASADWDDAQWEPVPDAEPPNATPPLSIIEPATDVDVTNLEAADLPTLVAKGRGLLAEAKHSTQSATLAAWKFGTVLNVAKAKCDHGTWEAWLDENFALSKRTAQSYMRLAKTKRVADLDTEQSLREALKGLCKTSREDKEPDLPLDSFLRRLKTLSQDARKIANAMVDIPPDKAIEIGDAMRSPLAMINALHDLALSDDTHDAAGEVVVPARSGRKTETVREMLLDVQGWADICNADIDPAEVKASELTREIAAFPAAMRTLNKFVKALGPEGG